MTRAEEIIIDLIKRSERALEVAGGLAQEYGINIDALMSAQKNEASNTDEPSTGRVDQLRNYFAKHGPTTRSKLAKETGIPAGTLGSLLTTYGKKLGDKKWDWDKDKYKQG